MFRLPYMVINAVDIRCQGQSERNFGVGCVRLWICLAEPPAEYRYEKGNKNKNI